MKKIIIIAVLSLTVLFSASAQKSKAKKKTSAKTAPTVVKSDNEKMGYAVGYDLGLKISSDIESKGLEIEMKSFLEGVQDAFLKKEASLSPEELQASMEKFQQQLQTKQDENMKKYNELVERTKKEGEEFLAANKTKDSVKVTASGLQYKILRTGSGPSPAETSSVVVDYRGRLVNGVIFDESYKRGEPITFKLNQVIRGWTEGLQLMNKGAKFEFYIPSELAYGDQPKGNLIPPGSTLIFEVELHDIK